MAAIRPDECGRSVEIKKSTKKSCREIPTAFNFMSMSFRSRSYLAAVADSAPSGAGPGPATKVSPTTSSLTVNEYEGTRNW